MCVMSMPHVTVCDQFDVNVNVNVSIMTMCVMCG
jgi:hypothetical protein